MNSTRVYYKLLLGLLLLLLSFLCASNSFAATAGYSEYYVPGSEDDMSLALRSFGPAPASNNTHALISITAWSDNVTVYYDHWENGLTFDPDNPAATADETFTLTTTGTILTLDNTPVGGIPIPRSPANTYYDGMDRIYAAGGAVTVTRVSWLESRGRSIQAVAWEIYPVKPQLTTYVLPFGENLSGSFPDFLRTYVVVQATADNTTFTVDLNGDGTPDPLDQNFDGDTLDPGDTTVVTLQAGESFFIGNVAVNPVPMPSGARATINSGAVIEGSSTLQVKFIVGDPAATYEARGISAFPRGYWTKDYYAPVDEPTNGTITDIFLYNPHASAITVNWETVAGSGSFVINAGATVSYRAAAGSLPEGGGVYLSGSDVFWGVSTVDSTGQANEWAYSLLPSTLLSNEHFLGWAPGGADGNDSGVFLTVVQDNTQVFVDTNNDGIAEQTFILNRLQSQYITDLIDGDLSGTRFWATGPFSMAYGQNPDTAPGQATSGDLGYVAIPGSDFISLVLTVDKAVSPQVVPTASGSTAAFTLTVNSQKYTVDGILVMDMLPANWQYLGPTSITLPDMTIVTTAPTITAAGAALPAPFVGNCPAGGGACLTWDNTVLGNMAENQQITIAFTAQTTAVLAAGTLSQNRVQAVGTRSFTNPAHTQTFTATNFAYVASGDLSIAKTSSATNPASPGDTVPYTVTVSSNSTQTGVSVYDPMPLGVTYLPGSGSVTCERSRNVRDEFASAAYNLNGPNNTANWSGSWTETDIHGTVAGATGGFVWITGNELQFRYQTSNYSDLFTTDVYTRNDGSNNWTGPWTETGDDGSASSGSITVDASDNNRVNFGPGAAGRAITRTAAVSGNSVTISFTLSDEGIDNNEGVIAEYDLGLGAGFQEIQRITNDTLTGTNPLTISTAGATSITLRFRTFGNWGQANDNAGVDTVTIAVNNAVGSKIQRTADLTGASNPALSFNYASANLEAGDTFVVEASSSAGGPFTTLATFTGGVPSVAPPYDLTSYISANTTIQLRITGGFDQTNETMSFDNVDISYYSPSTFASGSAPNFLSSAAGCRIRSGVPVTLTFNTTVDNPLPSGIDSIINTASVTTAQLPIALTASAENNVLVPSALSASAGGRIWLDADGDGVQDIGEPGIPNVEVTLKDRFGTPVATTLTDGNGRYLFTGVTAGTGYYGEVTDGLSIGLTQTYPYISTPGDLINNRTISFDLTDGQVYSSADLGYRASAGTASFGDQIWVDPNANGVRDPGEIGLGGVTLKLYRDLNGNGLLNDLTDLPTGAGTVSATNGSPDVVGTGTAFATVNAGDPITISGVAYTVLSVTDPTHLTLTANYTGTTGGSKAYAMPIATVSNPDGTYLFTGAAATGTETYFVSASTPTGYVPTSGSTIYKFINVAAGSTLITADFGFNSTGTTYSIKDRIWTDTNGDGLFSGESGIAGVSVELLDASLNVIGTTTTASDGSFTFSGLAGGGADYTVRINDTGGVLADYYGTTPYALALKRAESNLAASIDRVATPPPSYGFRPLRSIGDTIFNDLVGGTDGVQDVGEPGIAGVVVSLYSDLNNDGLIAGETLLGSVTTDASGQYLFSGLADANYIVSVPIPAGYNFIPNGGVNLDTDVTTATIVENKAAMVGGVNVLTKDFGFRAPVSRTISGTIWDDLDADGVIDGGESLLAGVTLEIRRNCPAPCTLVATLTTDASGAYSLAGLINDNSYTVRVTDTNSILTGNDPSFEYGVGTGGPFDNQAPVDLTSGNVNNANFGFNKIKPTLVTISSFRTYNQGGQVAVEWTTSSQIGTAGFYLFRLDGPTGTYRQINRTILPALPGTRGGTYSLIDKGASLTNSHTYALLEIERRGKQYAYGPFTVLAGGGNALKNSYRINTSDLLNGLTIGVSVADEASGYTMKAHENSPRTKARLTATKAAKTKGFSLKKMRKGDQIKMTVIKDGLYYIDASEIAGLLGMPRNTVIHAIRNTKLALSNQGLPTAYMPSDDYSGLFFYGQSIDSLYTKENIYWLYRGEGSLMAQAEGSGPVPSDQETFTATVHAEEAIYYLTTPELDPESDYWFWSYHFVAPSYTDYAANTFTIQTYGVADVPATASLTVRVKGFTDTAANPDHHVRVSLMDGAVTKATADGWLEGTNVETPVILEFDQSLLNNGNNTIKVEAISDPGVPYSAFFVDSFDLTYQRLYEAHDNALDFRTESAQPVTVYGFTSPSILVLDLTDPQNPLLDEATTIQDEVGSFSVSFVPASPGRRYLVITSNKAVTGLTTWLNAPSNLGARRNMADYLIITTDELMTAAQGLATYRKGQGYQTMVVNLENIMDEFNYGIYSPWAIKDFLTYAHYNWLKPPKYVVLVGEGTYDYKDNKGNGDNLVPTMIVKTPDGLFASDNILADADGDHIPDVAIGRLPVLTAEELQTLISKIITYESTSGKKVLMISDNADPGGNFPAVSHDIAQLVPAGYNVENMSLADYSVGDIRNKLLSGISANTFLLNYIGHGNPFMLADEGLLFTTDISSMQNPGRLFVMSGMTCLMADFAIPGFDSVSEELLMRGNSGAAAVWAPSALALNDHSKIVDEGFFTAAFSGSSVTLGNSINKAFTYYKSKGMPDYILDIYNLLGDPALRFPVK